MLPPPQMIKLHAPFTKPKINEVFINKSIEYQICDFMVKCLPGGCEHQF